MTKKLRFQTAFSIIELLVVLLIVVLASAMMLPSWQNMVEKNRASIFVNNFSSLLNFARASAIKLNEKVIFCGSGNGKDCDNDWAQGQIIITDSGSLLKVLPKFSPGDCLEWKGSAISKNEVVFSANGDLNEQRGHFYYYPNGKSDHAISLVLERTGRVRVESLQIKT